MERMDIATPPICWYFKGYMESIYKKIGKSRRMSNSMGREFICYRLWIWDLPRNKDNEGREMATYKRDRL